jgi:hypothetical protein
MLSRGRACRARACSGERERLREDDEESSVSLPLSSCEPYDRRDDCRCERLLRWRRGALVYPSRAARTSIASAITIAFSRSWICRSPRCRKSGRQFCMWSVIRRYAFMCAGSGDGSVGCGGGGIGAVTGTGKTDAGRVSRRRRATHSARRARIPMTTSGTTIATIGIPPCWVETRRASFKSAVAEGAAEADAADRCAEGCVAVWSVGVLSSMIRSDHDRTLLDSWKDGEATVCPKLSSI